MRGKIGVRSEAGQGLDILVYRSASETGREPRRGPRRSAGTWSTCAS